MQKNPFLDFYNRNNIIPVHQDISNLENHFARRVHLYSTMGVPVKAIEGKTILEIGPGTGDNAVAINLMQPARYVLLDGSDQSISELNMKLDSGLLSKSVVEVRPVNFEKYIDVEKYDVVLCEGLLPGQNDPKAFFSKAAHHCSSNGILVTTVINYCSILSEVLRRNLRPLFSKSAYTFEQQQFYAAKFFQPHLARLNTQTRSAIDWATDNILHDWLTKQEQVFSLSDALDAIGQEFTFQGASPQFYVDDRWYKSVNLWDASRNDFVRSNLDENDLLSIDNRVSFSNLNAYKSKKGLAAEIRGLATELFRIHTQIIKDDNFDKVDSVIELCGEVRQALPDAFGLTKAALADYEKNLLTVIDSAGNENFDAFNSWWGRGQQYVAFTRNSGFLNNPNPIKANEK